MQGTRGELQGYEPFGSLLPGRNYSSDSYRFGFNGKPKDDEIYGSTGASYDFGDRMYDARVGVWLTTDPLAHKFPGWSPYNFVLGNPIRLVDPDGRAPECGCPTPPCGEVINRLEAVYNAITDPIAQARDNAMNTIGSGLNTLGNWLNGLTGDGGVTLTSRKRDVPTNNADRKGNADRELNIDYLMDFNDAISIDGPNSPPTLPERGAETFTDAYNKLWEAGNIVKDNLTKKGDSNGSQPPASPPFNDTLKYPNGDGFIVIRGDTNNKGEYNHVFRKVLDNGKQLDRTE